MAQIVSDNFNGIAGQTLQAHNPAWVKISGVNGDMTISADGVVSTTAGGTAAYYRNDAAPSSPDYAVSTDIINGPGFPGVTARTSTTANTFYHARINGSVVELYKFVGGSASVLATPNAGLVTGKIYNLRLEVIGSSVKVYLGGVSAAIISVTDTSIVAAGKPGLRQTLVSSPAGIDNFSADTLEVAQPVQLTINHIESGEATSATGNVAVLATVSNTEPGESHSIAAEMAVRFLVNHSETGETHSISGRVDVLASANWTDGNETTSAAIQVGGGVSLAVNNVESNETHAIAARIAVSAAISHSEVGDSHSIVMQVAGGEIGDINALTVPPRQTVVFEGSRRVVAFEGGKRVVSFEGSKRLVEFQ